MKKEVSLREISIPTKNGIFTVMVIITVAVMLASLFFIWWAGLIISALINYFYLREFYPSVSLNRAKKIMKSSRMYRKDDKNIPCPIYFIRLISERNNEFHYKHKTYRWFLTTNPEVFKDQQKRVIKIKGENCFFFIQDYYSKEYVKEARETETRLILKTAMN